MNCDRERENADARTRDFQCPERLNPTDSPAVVMTTPLDIRHPMTGVRTDRAIVDSSDAIRRSSSSCTTWRPNGCDGAAPRRDRHGQGGLRSGDSRAEPPAAACRWSASTAPRFQPRSSKASSSATSAGPSPDAVARQIGRFEDGQRVDDLPGRDRRTAARHAGEAAAGARGTSDRAPRAAAQQSTSTCGSSPRRIETSSSGWPRTRSAKICSTA